MWLKYGVHEDNRLISIEEATSGKTNLTCLYCGGRLTAKKGKIKEHHFAHTEETCYPVANKQVPSLPLYDNFNIKLSGKELEELKVFWKSYGITNEDICIKPSWRLVSSKLLVWNSQGFYGFTDLGKIPVGALSLERFNEVQEPLILDKLLKLEGAAERAKLINSRHLIERVADFRIYCAQLKRILECTLYFLEIKTGRKTLYKIGVTKRPIEERVSEVYRDLAAHYKQIEKIGIQVLDTWEHRGNVELYFKHRYKDYNYRIGKLTEYFKFDDVEPVLQDLHQMKPKILGQKEVDILKGKDSLIESDRHTSKKNYSGSHSGAVRLDLTP